MKPPRQIDKQTSTKTQTKTTKYKHMEKTLARQSKIHNTEDITLTNNTTAQTKTTKKNKPQLEKTKQQQHTITIKKA